jgi:hypothetical protein
MAGHIFRVFVSSTFDNMRAECNALQEHVFPHLRELYAAHGARFQAAEDEYEAMCPGR